MRSIGIGKAELKTEGVRSELWQHTKSELAAMAAEASIDISSCNTKEEIINAIESVCAE